MPWGGPYTQLPKEVAILAAAIPTGLTDVTTADTEIAELEFTNTTASTITVTVQDKQASPIPLLSAVNVDPNSPVILPYDPPRYMKGGVSWQASGAGVDGTLRGRKIMGLTMGAATATSNNQPIPV